MPLIDKVSVECAGLDAEELFFHKQEQERLKALRAKAEQDAGDQYRDEHKNHCFRCGTPSLVEVDHGGVKIDICVNKDCGAVHLDPGELDAIISAGAPAIKRVQMAVFNIFKQSRSKNLVFSGFPPTSDSRRNREDNLRPLMRLAGMVFAVFHKQSKTVTGKQLTADQRP